MPRKLKAETIQRLEGSQDALELALCSLAFPASRRHSTDESRCGIEIGLIGAAGELAVTACLNELVGASALTRKNKYIRAGDAVAELRTLLGRGRGLGRITQGLENPDDHIADLLNALRPIAALPASRAASLHAGVRMSRSIAFAGAGHVEHLLRLLALGSKWAPYLKRIPRVSPMPAEKTVLVDELMELTRSEDINVAARAVSGVFLVVPDLPEDEPEWVQALDRLAVAPTRRDLTLLVAALEGAKAASLVSVGSGVDGHPVRYTKDGSAISITQAQMKKSLKTRLERWRADVGMANGKLEDGIFSPPPTEDILEYFSAGMRNLGIPEDELDSGLSAHDVWPFVAGSILLRGNQLSGPCFFAMNYLKSGEVGQLMAILQKCVELKGKDRLAERLRDYEPILRAASGDHTVDLVAQPIYLQLEQEWGAQRRARKTVIADIKASESPEKTKLVELLKGKSDLVGALAWLADAGSCDPLLARRLVASATKQSEMAGLLKVLAAHERKELANGLSTNIRRAMRAVDWGLYGRTAVSIRVPA